MQEAVVQCLECMHDQPHLGFHNGRVEPIEDRWERMIAGTPWVASCTVTVDADDVETCSGPEAGDALSYAAFGDHGTREFFTHVRFHKHDEDRIVVHLLVELYSRSAEEATEVLEEAARGTAGDHLAGRGVAAAGRRPATTSTEPPRLRAAPRGAGAGRERATRPRPYARTISASATGTVAGSSLSDEEQQVEQRRPARSVSSAAGHCRRPSRASTAPSSAGHEQVAVAHRDRAEQLALELRQARCPARRGRPAWRWAPGAGRRRPARRRRRPSR